MRSWWSWLGSWLTNWETAVSLHISHVVRGWLLVLRYTAIWKSYGFKTTNTFHHTTSHQAHILMIWWWLIFCLEVITPSESLPSSWKSKCKPTTDQWSLIVNQFLFPLSLQSASFSSPSCVFWAPHCLHSAPTLKELPICCRSCSQDDCSLDQATALWPVRLPYRCCAQWCQVKAVFLSCSVVCILISRSEPHHGILVQREGAGPGFRSDSGLLPPGLSPELLPHAEIWRELRHAVDTLGR